MQISKRFPILQRLVNRNEKAIERFQAQQAAFFHPYAVKLCQRIKKGIPEFEGCMLAMRTLFLEPRDLKLTVTNPEGERKQERLANIIDGGYLEDDGTNSWKVVLPERTQQALRELDELANYVDDNYSNVAELVVSKEELE